ncbi:alpha/beta hydrolase [Flagellimonas sp.]|uniref:alpha/beta hydrolase n=1 Tax=Flagellimonas sp. TaxID=2058762 RepID=UPI003BA898C7
MVTTIIIDFKLYFIIIKTDSSHLLPDGRKLGYAEYGDPNGTPIFYFHGGQESRLSSRFMDSTASRLGIRIIAPDRPGIGLSSFQVDRNFLDWAEDIEFLAKQLKLKTFSIFGLSGGAPHVLACAYALPHRIHRVAIVSGTGPHDYSGKLKGVWLPVKMAHWFARLKNDFLLRTFISREYKELKENPEKRLLQLQKFLPESDGNLFKKHPEFGIDFINGSLEAYKQGVEAVIQEWQLYVKDWGFPLEEITTHIDLWYGGEDKMAPKYRGLHYHKIFQDSNLHLFEKEGHFSLIRNHLDKILRNMIYE